MKKPFLVASVFLAVAAMPRESVAQNDIEVLLARTSTSVSQNVVRNTLLQMNNTLVNSGILDREFVAANTNSSGIPQVEFVSGCNQTDGKQLTDCLRSKLSSKRNSHAADIVVTVVPTIAVVVSGQSVSLCGAVPPSMLNSLTISDLNESDGYAAVTQSCMTNPTNNLKVASHEVGHLLSLEHHDSDPATNLPLGFPFNHAEEDFDDHTVMGSPTDDCVTPFVNCNGHDFFSAVGATFPDGGTAGHASRSNARLVVQIASWDSVAAYRPMPQQAADCSFTIAACFNGGPHDVEQLITPELSGYTVTNQKLFKATSGGGWQQLYNGNPNCVANPIYSSTLFKALLTTSLGLMSECEILVQPEQCFEWE